MKIVHAADLHLDSPLCGLSRYENAPVERVRGASRRAVENLVDLCVRERASLLLLAGDLYDGKWRDYNTGLFFVKQMARLRDANVQVCLAAGNHDAQNHMTRSLRLPDNVVSFPTDRADTHVCEHLGVAVHGRGFPDRKVGTDFVQSYPAAIEGLFNIGVLHTSLEGNPDHAPYAACSVADLVGKRYDYWALGHVHRRNVVHRSPWIVYPGNVQGRHARETGAKGATVVQVNDQQQITSAEACDLDVLRWEHKNVDLRTAMSGDDMLEAVHAALTHARESAGGRVLALRLTLQGASAAHGDLVAREEAWQQEIRALATHVSDGEAWVERVLFRTRPLTATPKTPEEDDALRSLLGALQRLPEDHERLTSVWNQLEDFRKKLATSEVDLPELKSPAELVPLLDDVTQLLVGELLSERVS